MSDRLANTLQWCKDRESGMPAPVIDWPVPPLEPYPAPIDRRAISFVYAIQAGDYVKIGIARDIAKRCATMQTGCPFEIRLLRAWATHEPNRLERRLHFRMREYRVRGEWFQIPDYILSGLV